MFEIQKICRALEAYKIGVFKNAYRKIWTENSNLILENLHKISFDFSRSNIFFICYQKIPLVFSLENISYVL